MTQCKKSEDLPNKNETKTKIECVVYVGQDMDHTATRNCTAFKPLALSPNTIAAAHGNSAFSMLYESPRR